MKYLIWVGSAEKDLEALPAAVQDELRAALTVAQYGGKSDKAVPMRGDLREVTEIKVKGLSATYRVMYTTKIGDEIYVLDAFQKKSKSGIATPKKNLDRLRQRLKWAREYGEEY